MDTPKTDITYLATRSDLKPVCKGFYWVPEWKGSYEWPDYPETVGRWKEDDVQKGQAVRTRSWYVEQHHTPNLTERLKLRRSLAEGHLKHGGLVQGVARGDIEFLLLKSTKTHTKDHRTFEDAPRRFFTMDIDGFDVSQVSKGFNVIEDEAEIPAVIADTFDILGLDWLIVNSIVHLSSSHGTHASPSILSAHVEFELKTHMTLAQQKQVVAYINSLAAKKFDLSTCKFLDGDVYDAPRIFYTNPPFYIAKTRTKQGVKMLDASAMMRVHQRVHFIDHGDPFLQIGDEVLNTIVDDQATTLPKRRQGIEGDTKFADGHTHIPIRNLTAAVAMNTPHHHLALEVARVQRKIRDEVMQLPGDEAKRRQRFIKTSVERIALTTLGMMKKRMLRCGHTTPENRRFKDPMDIDTVREVIKSEMASALDDGLTTSDSVFSVPTHTLFLVPPGVGKTHAVLAGIDRDRLEHTRISMLVPTKELGSEVKARYLKAVREIEDETLVRHNRGRSDLCLMKGKAHGLMCDTLESCGMSAVQAVCSHCPKNDICKYPSQQNYHGPGLIIGQHQHAFTSMKRTKTTSKNAQAFQIIDESLVGSVISSDANRRTIHKLEEATKRAKLKGLFTTADLVGFRAELLDIMRKRTSHILATDELKHMRRTVFIKRGEHDIGMEAYRAAHQLEKDLERELRSKIGDEVKAFNEEYSKGKKGKPNKHKRNAQRLQSDLATCEWFLTAFRAIEASMDIPGRDRVFGLRLTKAGALSARIRRDLPEIWGQLDGIHLDGTADPEVFRTIMRKSGVNTKVVEHEVLPGPYTLTQYTDKPYGKSMFLRSKEANSNLQRLFTFIAHKSMVHGGSVLVVTQLPIRNALADMGAEQFAALAHFNALRGIDKHKDKACIIVVGRNMPAKEDLELMAEILHYDDQDVPQLIYQSKDFHTEQRFLRRAGHKEAHEIQAESHPDTRVAALMRQLVNSEVKQAVARLRLYDRTEDNPAELHVFGQTDTGLDVTSIRDWTDARILDVDFPLASGIVFAGKGLEFETLKKYTPWLNDSSREKALKKASGVLRDLGLFPINESVLALNRDSSFNLSYKKNYSNYQEPVPIRFVDWTQCSVKVEGRRKALNVWVNTAQHGKQVDQLTALFERETGEPVVSLDLHSLSLGS